MIHVGSLVVPTSGWFYAGAVGTVGGAWLTVRTKVRRRPARPRGGPTSLYRFYSGEGTLLYLGITERGSRRFAEHARVQPWWPLVASSVIEHFDTRAEAERAEMAAIAAERPLYNQVGQRA